MEKDLVFLSITKLELIELFKSTFLEIQNTPIDVDEIPMSQVSCAKYLNISVPTLLKWRRLNLIPYEQVGERHKVKYYKSQIRVALLKNRHLLKTKI